MGGCANSKYAVDEDTKNKPEHDTEKKSKKPFLNIKKLGNVGKNAKKEEEAKQTATPSIVPEQNGTEHKNGDVPNKEEIEFIDTAAATSTVAPPSLNPQKEDDNDDAKKEVTTYQTTVVKHTQKEGDELLQHLREEAFRSLSASLKHLNTNTTKTTTATAGESGEAQTVDDDQASSQSAEELISQVKAQVITSLGRQKQDEIAKIVDSGVELIRESKVKSMNELEQELEKVGYEGELVKKVVNATTGFLTAKGTEAGALLSNILANVSQGIQGVMNETEKTTVKVTRTITEQVLSGGQIKEVTRVITEPISSVAPPATLTDILKNLTSGGVKSGTQVTHSSTQETQEHESLTSNIELKEKAEKVVSQAVEAAVEKLADETSDLQNGEESIQEEKIKIEEESTVKTSTTKIILNGGDDDEKHLENVAAEFFKNGKHEAEIVVKKLDEDGMIVVDNGEEALRHDDVDETKKKEDATELTAAN